MKYLLAGSFFVLTSTVTFAAKFECHGFCYTNSYASQFIGNVKGIGENAFEVMLENCNKLAKKHSSDGIVAAKKVLGTYDRKKFDEGFASSSASFANSCIKL